MASPRAATTTRAAGTTRAATEALAAAKKSLDETSGVNISLATEDLPNGVTGITSAEGTGVHPSAFEGTFKLSVSGLPADAEVIAVDGTTYAKNSLLLPHWTPIDPSDYGAPDPAKLMDPDDVLQGCSRPPRTSRPATRCAAARTTRRSSPIHRDHPLRGRGGPDPDAEGDFDALHHQRRRELREAVLTGAFYGEDEGEVTYTLTLDDYGTEKEITAP